MGPGLILSLSALGLWPLGLALALRWRRRPNVGGPMRPVSVVIPARDEETSLPILLDSIARQSVQPLEVIVVDDGSTDGTAEVARARGARVVRSAPLPDGWRGKPWACHQGAQAARGDWLLFLDADTRFEPEGMKTLLRGFSGGAWSVGPWHDVRRPHEQLSLFFNIAMTAGTVPRGLFGPSLLIDRNSYERAGGHASVRDRILENFFLAGRLRSAGVPLGSERGRGIFSVRLYPTGLSDLCRGWAKAFASGAAGTSPGVLLNVVLWMIGLGLAFLALFIPGPRAGPMVLYLLYALQVFGVGRQVGGFSFLSALFYPVPLFFFFGVFGWSAFRRGKTVRWKGRTLRAD